MDLLPRVCGLFYQWSAAMKGGRWEGIDRGGAHRLRRLECRWSLHARGGTDGRGERLLHQLARGIYPLARGIYILARGLSGGIGPLSVGISPLSVGISPLDGGISALAEGISALPGGLYLLTGGRRAARASCRRGWQGLCSLHALQSPLHGRRRLRGIRRESVVEQVGVEAREVGPLAHVVPEVLAQPLSIARALLRKRSIT